MSFLEQIKNKKGNLKTTETIITHSDGSSYKENTEMRILGVDPIKKEDCPKKYGFIVDTKPDNVPVQVIPGLYIGSQDCVAEDILEKYKFTNIMSIGVDSSSSHLNKKFIPCLDLPETCISEILKETCSHIRFTLQNGSVLVHCNAGVSRSAMVVIGYLILEEKYSFNEAYDLLKRMRPCIQPNSGFVSQLKLLEKTVIK